MKDKKKDNRVLSASLGMVLFACLLLWPGLGWGQDTIGNGLSCLASRQNPDGSWGDANNTAFRDTTVVVDTLNSLGQDGAILLQGVTYVDTSGIPNQDYLARQIVTLERSGRTPVYSVAALLANQNDETLVVTAPNYPEGGWGVSAELGTDVLTTALALNALKAVGFSTGLAVVKAVVQKGTPNTHQFAFPTGGSNLQLLIREATGNVRLSIQTPTSGTFFVDLPSLSSPTTIEGFPEETGTYVLTMETLSEPSKTYSLEARFTDGDLDVSRVTRTLSYLGFAQNADGSWGISRGEDGLLMITAEVLLTLEGYGSSFGPHNLIEQGLNWLKNRQNTDGGFGSDPGVSTVHETALVILALLGSDPKSPAIVSARNFLSSSQGANGCWNNDAYKTALAIRALMGQALNAANLSSPSDGVTGQPVALSLQWSDTNNSFQEQGYRVRIKPEGGSYSNYTAGQNATSYPVSGLLSYTKYYWNVQGVGDGSITLDSDWANGGTDWSFTTAGQTLIAATLSFPSDGATGQPVALSLQWSDTNSAPQEQGYRVRIKPEGGSYSNYTTGQNATSYPVSGLLSYTKYYWNVQAMGNGSSTLDSDWANGGTDWSFTTVGQTLIAATLSSPSNGATGQPFALSLQWSDTNNAPQEQGYRLRIKPEGGSYSIYTTGQDATSYPISGLSSYTKYYWNVQAMGNGSSTLDSDWANGGTDWSFTTVGQTLIAATLSSPSDGATGLPVAFSLQWSDTNSAPQEQGYRVRIKPEGGSYSNYTTGQNATSYPVSGLLSHTKYYWNVQAIGTGGSTLDSDWANGGTDWSFTTIHSQPFPFVDDFSTDKGWFGYEVGGWERKPAHAGGGANGNPDPATDYTDTPDNYILGYAIGADYANGMDEEEPVVSPPIDCTGQHQVFLKFRRWLNVESQKASDGGDHARIYVSTDGVNWGDPVWENPGYDLTDDQWTQAVIDIADIAADEPTVYIKFTMGPTNSTRSFSGWNIDDLEVTSEAIYPAEGTIGTGVWIPNDGYGLKKGKVLIGTTALKVISWTDTLIHCSLSKALSPGVYDLTIQPKEPKGVHPVVMDSFFSIMFPDIESLSSNSGTVGETITIKGKFFGAKKGKVTIGGKSCKVMIWTMDAATGVSGINFLVPKGLNKGIYDLKVTNKVGEATESFTID